MSSPTTTPGLFGTGVVISDTLLRQPEPQYFFAQLLYGSYVKAEFTQGAREWGVSPDRSAPAGGGAVPSFSEQQLKLMDDVRSDAFIVDLKLLQDATGDLREVAGQAVKFRRPVFLGGTMTAIARVINASVDVSTTPMVQTGETTILTLQPQGGPHNGTVISPLAISSLTSKSGEYSISEYDQMLFQRDRTALLDAEIVALLTSGTRWIFPRDEPFTYTAVGDVNAAFVTARDRKLDLDTIYRTQQIMRTNKIQPFADGTYMMVLHEVAARQFSTDPKTQSFRHYDREVNPLLGMKPIGRVENMELYVSTTIPTGTANGSVTYYKNVAFGPGALGFAPGIPPHVRFSNTDNYGMNPRGIWVAVEALGLLDERFTIVVASD